MFDVGFSELMLIAVVALVVIGPERLPGVARTVGHLFGKLQRYVNDVKADISREIELDELKKFKNQFEEAAQSVESSVRSEVAGAEAAFDSIAADLNPLEEPGLPEHSVLPSPGVADIATTAVPTQAAAAEVPAEDGASAAAESALAAPAVVEQKTAA